MIRCQPQTCYMNWKGDVFINICQFDEAKLKPDTLGYSFHWVITGFALGMASDPQVGIPQK